MGSMFVSLKEERGLELHDQGRLVQDNVTGGRAKLHNQHTLLFYDTNLIRRKSARVEQFIELRLDASNSSVLDALIQALDQLDGTLSEAEAIDQTQALTRRYARRQVSWFQRYPAAPAADAAAIAQQALDTL